MPLNRENTKMPSGFKKIVGIAGCSYWGFSKNNWLGA